MIDFYTFAQFGENALMYFICIACLNGSERLHRNNNVQWIAEHGVRFVRNSYQTRAFYLILFYFFGYSYCGAEGSILTRMESPNGRASKHLISMVNRV